MKLLSDYFSVKRRYMRSVNLERDIEIADSVNGYIPTARAIDVLNRFVRAYSRPHSVRAWTLTGAYGTGKSAFADFLTSVCAPQAGQNNKNAIKILKQNESKNSILKQINEEIPEAGLIRAVATAQREPIANTIVKALNRGVSIYWHKARGAKPKALKELEVYVERVENGETVDNPRLVNILQGLARVSKTGVLLILDELGKNFEFCAQNQALDDLYLLQQIAELPAGEDDPKIFLIGLLHQSFVDYAHGLTSVQRNEWAKIQGRFEDIPFVDSSEGVMRLIGQAIDQSNAKHILSDVQQKANQWKIVFKEYDFANNISADDIAAIYPLHPISSVVLPILCTKFSQNDRTLFTFLSSNEPNSFTAYLSETTVKEKTSVTLKLYKIYDYFIEAAGMSFSLRPQFQRWLEIQSRISDVKHLGQDAISIMKTIGILNLISNTGSLRATCKSVALSMCDNPKDPDELSYWDKIINKLVEKGFLTWRKQIDELRIWEGSDFDIEKEISEQAHMLNISLADLFNEHFPLKPQVAQRHSYETGTLRYFERQYLDNLEKLKTLKCKQSDSDGLICYWLGKEVDIEKIPSETEDGKPVIIICATQLKALRIACNEYVALKKIDRDSTQLQTDGVARREVKQRLLFSQRILSDTLSRSFSMASKDVVCFVQREKKNFKSQVSFQKCLSEVCNQVYNKGLSLWNELVNKRVTTSQGSAARRMLIEAMIENVDQEKLGLDGQGPEVSLFESILKETGIYREENGRFVYTEPYKNSGVFNVWKAIETFCMSATDSTKEVAALYKTLESPPYGVKQGAVPILLLSVLLYHNDIVSIYMDRTFVPVLGLEHFELFFRKPERFSVKYFEISGLRAKVFKELESIFSDTKTEANERNSTVLSIVKPLIKFAKKLPQFTLNTKERLSLETIAVRKALLKAKEPDMLLFSDLPKACGVSPFIENKNTDEKNVKIFKTKLVQRLKELQTAYETLIIDCKNIVHSAFSIRSEKDKLREDLRVRATYLSGQVTEDYLKRFILAATDEYSSDQSWIETLLMILADKPPRVWRDVDVTAFETKLTGIARRFKNLEAIQKDLLKIQNDGFDVRRVTVTKPDGFEINKMVWIDRESQKKIDKIAQTFIEENKYIKEALTAALIEKVFVTDKTTKDIKQTIKKIEERKV